ncbi:MULTISPECIES: DUF1972 domain-containing protein [unclassified Brenneria]|uniref:DUF1972 domain-containing protein n=1 Tax=unclassified Brenneria TaxID=2634434 RepID=UPI001552EE2D|nr:DUF1972 domain-containing protein [Brenneria sp. hezel4-2-4]MEE3650980.1 DUF1972 domain-containing protein [Brenneria sp. HEZEL_4_2_4]NPD00935.1 DUF1972 domain-containing protein [Brenneria sp. hezel4-2-4]
MKKISVVGTVGLPACYGGFESLVDNLNNYRTNGIKYVIYCSSKTYKDKIKEYKGAELRYINLKANGIQSILYDVFSLAKCLFYKTDVILILGVSGCIFLPLLKYISKSKVITNIDGLEWKRDKWNSLARWFLKKSEYFAVKYSDVVIADNIAISEYVNTTYGVYPEVIAYGGDHAVQFNTEKKRSDYFFSVCRIEPENNIKMILDSFAKTTKKLKIVGNWNNSIYGSNLRKNYSQYANLDLIDPVYDQEELFYLRDNCIGYIHGHSAGGTNPSLVEAMHFAVNIYAFDCSFNRYTTENNAFYFKNSDELIALISKNMEHNIGPEMSAIANREYTWRVITEKYESLY